MPVLINFKICDNTEGCNGITLCPTGAFHWNKEKKTLEIDRDKCIECGLCANSQDTCPVKAIHFARNEEERKKIQKELDEDPRSQADLVADRYGASLILPQYGSSEEMLKKYLTTTNLCLIEIYEEEQAECLIKSIPCKNIMKAMREPTVYRKVDHASNKLKKKYGITETPTMLIFKNKSYIGKVEGFYSADQEEELINHIKEVIKSIESIH